MVPGSPLRGAGTSRGGGYRPGAIQVHLLIARVTPPTTDRDLLVNLVELARRTARLAGQWERQAIHNQTEMAQKAQLVNGRIAWKKEVGGPKVLD
ncbi:jg25812 [Pararge aegeria aegeria]|uniref:Jg25812 protein n=1 Tax=Pararge aegeria aegeria TaxID=348720 RepID=A0A8S4QXX4_9NEOP|nr:jg25812 [Pararge aegeria aegeria]